MAPRQFALSTDTGKSDDSAYSRNDVHNALAKSADTAEMGGHPPRVGRSSVVGLHGSSARLTEIVPSGKQRSCEGLWIRMQVHALAGQQSTCRCNSLRGRMLRIRAAVHTLTPLCAQTSGGTPAATLRPSLPRPLVRIGRPLRPAAHVCPAVCGRLGVVHAAPRSVPRLFLTHLCLPVTQRWVVALPVCGVGQTHHAAAACPRPLLTCTPPCAARSVRAAAVCAGAPGLGPGRVHALPRRHRDLVYFTAAGQPGPP